MTLRIGRAATVGRTAKKDSTVAAGSHNMQSAVPGGVSVRTIVHTYMVAFPSQRATEESKVLLLHESDHLEAAVTLAATVLCSVALHSLQEGLSCNNTGALPSFRLPVRGMRNYRAEWGPLESRYPVLPPRAPNKEKYRLCACWVTDLATTATSGTTEALSAGRECIPGPGSSILEPDGSPDPQIPTPSLPLHALLKLSRAEETRPGFKTCRCPWDGVTTTSHSS